MPMSTQILLRSRMLISDMSACHKCLKTLAILIVLVLNTQKHLVVTSDFCMFHDKIIEGWHKFFICFIDKIMTNSISRKKTAKSTSCFQNNNMETYGLTNTISRPLHDSNCENINSRLKMTFFSIRNVWQENPKSFCFWQATIVLGRNILIQDKRTIIYKWEFPTMGLETNIVE